MKKWIKSSRMVIGAFAVALFVTVFVLMSSGGTQTAQANEPEAQTEQIEESSAQFVSFVGDINPTSMGKKWSGAD